MVSPTLTDTLMSHATLGINGGSRYTHPAALLAAASHPSQLAAMPAQQQQQQQVHPHQATMPLQLSRSYSNSPRIMPQTSPDLGSRHLATLPPPHPTPAAPQPHASPDPAPRIKRMTLLPPQPQTDSPYLFDLYDFPGEEGQLTPPLLRKQLSGGFSGVGLGLPSPHFAMPPEGLGVTDPFDDTPLPQQSHADFFPAMARSISAEFAHHLQSKEGYPADTLGCLPMDAAGLEGHHELSCERCWEEAARCAECTQLKQQQLLHGWPAPDALPHAQLYQELTHAHALSHADLVKEPLVLDAPIKLENEPDQPGSTLYAQQQEGGGGDEEKSSEQPPAAVTLTLTPPAPGVGQGYEILARRQGKLARFLPEGVDPLVMEPLSLPPSSYSLSQPAHAAPASAHASLSGHGRGSRSLRVRKVRSRSPSPDLSERSSTTGHSYASESEYDTDHYSECSLDDRLSPPPSASVRVLEGGGSDTSGQSSSEPPVPTDLLPVSASALLPSRPSTAAIPPAHIKDRLVKSAKKLLTAADGVNDAVQVQVIPIWYPNKQAANAHKIRLIRVTNTDNASVSVYAHAADVGGVVERKSNISRLFGKFDSPSEKLLMNVVGAHNHTVGQESNILTSKGVRKFLATNKMREEHAYRAWITTVLLPMLLNDPLEIGTELVEIEASTDPNAPRTIKPKKMKRMEKKRLEKKQQMKAERKAAMAHAAGHERADDDDEDFVPGNKRQKLLHHSPPMTGFAPPMSHAA